MLSQEKIIGIKSCEKMKEKLHKLLIVDDEESFCEILQFNLEGEGYETEIAYSAEEALKKDLSFFDLIILDVMMGKMSGFKMADKIRKTLKLSIPIIFITARTAENDLLTGFNLGADDFITKPFSIKEVIVRVKAVLKRAELIDRKKKKIITIDDFVFDIEKKNLRIDDKKIQLTKKEFEILSILLKADGRMLSREDILNKVWSDGSIVADRTVDVHLTRLRKKIGEYGKYITSKSGFGYSFSIE